MRLFLITILSLAMTLSAILANANPDLDSRSPLDKASMPRAWNPGTPDGRQGGETMADAFPIPSFPFQDTGNTSDNLDDYDAVCPHTGSVAPDVVYALPEASEDIWVRVDMCGSGFDTKIYILNADGEVIACNDDAYFSGDPCGTYVSMIEQALLPVGGNYFLVIDGYGQEAGDYTLEIEEVTSPLNCVLECTDGIWEGEPDPYDGYVDEWNSGCINGPGSPLFQIIGGLCWPDNTDICGSTGWYDQGNRDTDWYLVYLGEAGILEWTLEAEMETQGALLGGDFEGCQDVFVQESILAGPCEPATMTIQGQPGELVAIWIGPPEFFPPDWFVGNAYDYIAHLEGVGRFTGVTATETINLDMIKTLYR